MMPGPEIQNGGFLLRLYPQLKTLANSHAFVAALADDYWLEQKATYLAIPDLASGEDPHWEKLIFKIPEVARFDLPGNSAGESEAAKYFRSVRRAAVRTICVAAELGSQTFLPTSHFGGDSSIKFAPAIRLNCRIGRLSDASWKPSPTLLARAIERLEEPGTIGAVEEVIFPIVGLDPQAREREHAIWASTGPLREHVGASRLPLTGVCASLPATPNGYIARYGSDDLVGSGVPIVVACRLSSPYAAPILRARRSLEADDIVSPADLVEWALKNLERATADAF
jgi:hypothetical protein